MRSKEPNEAWHQEQVFKFARANQTKDRRLCFLHASLNGVKLSNPVAIKMKRQGMRAGVPDLFLPVRSGSWSGLFIELKKIGGKVSDPQKDWIKFLNEQGYKAIVCYGWKKTVEEIINYLEG